MNKALKDLMENNTGLDSKSKIAIHEAWESQVAELREEFAQRYDHDKSRIIEAVDDFITTRVHTEITELAEDKQALADEKVKYRRAIREHTKLVDRFVTEAMTKEVRELRKDRAQAASHTVKLDEFVTRQLAVELREFHEDKKALVEQKVKLAVESKRQIAESKKKFITAAASSVENLVTKVLKEEIKTLRSDITASRENDFGRRIFETFANEYGTTYLNENAEIKKITNTLSQVKTALSEARNETSKVVESRKLSESKRRIAEDRLARSVKLNELMKPLGRDKREVMLDLLESVDTKKLETTFNKYLPSLLEGGNTPLARRKVGKRTLSESKSSVTEHTGNRKVVESAIVDKTSNEDLIEIEKIRKLAGLSD